MLIPYIDSCTDMISTNTVGIDTKDIHVGDIVRILNLEDNTSHNKGFYDSIVEIEDSDSIGLSTWLGAWYFDRDTCQSYCGNAQIIALVSKHFVFTETETCTMIKTT